METEKFCDIYDYIFIPFWKTKTFFISIASLVVLALIITTYFIIRYLKRKKKKIITPAEWALSQLRALKPETYKKKEEFKQFYFTATSIMKTYIKMEYHLDVQEKTDEELIKYLKEQGLYEKIGSKLETVFGGALLIKFANAQALRDQAQQDLSTLLSLVAHEPPL